MSKRQQTNLSIEDIARALEASEGENKMNWKHNFQLKDLLSGEDMSREEAAALGVEAARRLAARPIFGRHQRDLVERFEDICCQGDFNEVLADLYEAADELSIWVE